MDEELVTIARYDSYLAAVAARDALEDTGIKCFVPELLGDRDVRNAYHPYPGLFRTAITVQVRRPDARQGIEVLQAPGMLTADLEEPEPSADRSPPCPACSSPYTYRTRGPWLVTVMKLLLLLPMVSRVQYWRCSDCRHRWRQ